MYKYSIKEAKLYLKAVNKLIVRYKKELEATSNCPLCIVNGQTSSGLCTNCPWVVYGEGVCFTLVHLPYGKKSLPRLRGWKIRFKNIIKKLEDR